MTLEELIVGVRVVSRKRGVCVGVESLKRVGVSHKEDFTVGTEYSIDCTGQTIRKTITLAFATMIMIIHFMNSIVNLSHTTSRHASRYLKKCFARCNIRRLQEGYKNTVITW